MSELAQSLNSSSVAETLATYNKWADKYNTDVAKEDYTAPELACGYVVKHLANRDIATVRILDAGCGTGLVGGQLAKRGAKQLDGIDLSPGMLRIARDTGFYQSLEIANLSQSLNIPPKSYDFAVCVGTLTQGHVGPEAFKELIKVVKSGGFVIATVRDSVWQKNGYERTVQELEESGLVTIASDQTQAQRIGTEVYAYFVVLQIR